MKLILTISGLCLLACKSDDGNPYPGEPSKVDVIIPDAPRHAPRITYNPLDYWRFGRHYTPDIVPDVDGGRLAAIDFTNGGLLKLDVDNPPPFSMEWGSDKTVPQYATEEKWMRWVPTLKELGFGNVTVPPNGPVTGSTVRLTLPGGHIMSRNVVKEANTQDIIYVKWKYPVVSIVKALANEIVCEIDNIVHVRLTDAGDEVLSMDMNSAREVRLSISNDLAKVPKEYLNEVDKLEHAVHFDVLTPVINPPFDPPYKEQRTARPICNQAIYVYTGNEQLFSERKKHTCHS
jgi:hypothetical protein